MPKQLVEVIDCHGHVVYSTTVALEGADCIEAEFEEVAIIFAESHAGLPKTEHVHLRAHCVK
jgi:hypothetical protein